MLVHLDISKNALGSTSTTIIGISWTSSITLRRIDVGSSVGSNVRTPATLPLKNSEGIIGVTRVRT